MRLHDKVYIFHQMKTQNSLFVRLIQKLLFFLQINKIVSGCRNITTYHLEEKFLLKWTLARVCKFNFFIKTSAEYQSTSFIISKEASAGNETLLMNINCFIFLRRVPLACICMYKVIHRYRTPLSCIYLCLHSFCSFY